MTVSELQHQIDEVLAFLGAMLRHDPDSADFKIARRLWEIDRHDERVAYLADLTHTYPQGTREHELAESLHTLLTTEDH